MSSVILMRRRSTAPENFNTLAINQLERDRPAVVVVDDDPTNETEASRFSVWGAATLAYVQEHYRYAGTYVRNEVYLRANRSGDRKDSPQRH